MARGMSRKDKLVLHFILWLALGTFLFGVWAMVVGFRAPSDPLLPPPSTVTNSTSR
jgi:ABC-type nitrate/sulfonate/bicarbonate transport system permease component